MNRIKFDRTFAFSLMANKSSACCENFSVRKSWLSSRLCQEVNRNLIQLEFIHLASSGEPQHLASVNSS